jgi:hypothetical protein
MIILMVEVKVRQGKAIRILALPGENPQRVLRRVKGQSIPINS